MKIRNLALTIASSFLLASCVGTSNSINSRETSDSIGNSSTSYDQPSAGGEENNRVLISYFSCTGNTEGIANLIANETGGTLYEIIAADPYTEEDLDYYTNCRADQEQNDPAVRPEISGLVSNMEAYDFIFLGYPIWHGQAPRIIYTFLESYEFANKTIVPFCTSGSSGITNSVNLIKALATDATWLDGRRFSSNASASDISDWIDILGL